MPIENQFDVLMFFKNGMPLIFAWMLLLCTATIFAVLGVVFDGKKRIEGKTVVKVDVRHENRFASSLFMTAFLVVSFLIWGVMLN
jgi:hypothetical protein